MSIKTPIPSAKPPSAGSKSLLSASAEGAKFLILLQISSRLLTFGVNQLLLRYLSPALLGVSVQLELLTISILYFSRESLRNALQRQPIISTSEICAAVASTQTVINISLLTIPLGVFFSAVLAWGYTISAEAAVGELPYFGPSVVLYVIATMLELGSEPGFAVAQMRLWYKLRAGAESAATFTRCMLTCGITMWAARRGLALGPLPFAVGQVGHGTVLMVIYGLRTWKTSEEEGFGVGLKKITGTEEKGEHQYHKGYFDKNLSSLAATMWIQSSIKHILTQGDSLLVAWLTTLQNQGIYALAANYGSLIARMLFQPLEESSRSLFSNLLSPQSKSKQTLTSASQILKTITKLYLLISIFFIVLGPPFAPVALSLIAGRRWAESAAGDVLACFCYYIPLLAINGITESFVQSVATAAELRRQSVWMFAFSLGFGAAGFVFVRTLEMGAQGLVWANVVNMALRIAWSSVFIGNYFGSNGVSEPKWNQVWPSYMLVTVGIGVGAAVRGQAVVPLIHELGLIKQLGVAAGAGGVMVVACAFTERKFFQECWEMIKAGR